MATAATISQHATATGTTTSVVSITAPSVNDLIIVGVYNNSTSSFTTPSGFASAIGGTNYWNGAGQDIFYKLASGSETNLTFSMTGGSNAEAFCQVWHNASTNIDTSDYVNSNTTGVTSITSDTISTSNQADLIYCFLAHRGSAHTAEGFGASSGSITLVNNLSDGFDGWMKTTSALESWSTTATWNVGGTAGLSLAVFKSFDRTVSGGTTNSTTVDTYYTNGTYYWNVANGITCSTTVQAWGAGGGGANGAGTSGGGGAFASSVIPVGGNSNAIVVGTGGAGGATTATISTGGAGGRTTFNTTSVIAAGGLGGTASLGKGGTTGSSTGSTLYAGGSCPTIGFGGGSSAGSTATGTNSSSASGAVAPSGGGNGGAANTGTGFGGYGSLPGGAGGSGGVTITGGIHYQQGGSGTDGQMKLTYTASSNNFFMVM